MNTHESYVSLETAKMLKECGFDWECETHYHNGCLDSVYGENHDYNSERYEDGGYNEYYSAPTLAVAQRWLREIKGIRFYITPNYYSHFNDNGEYTHESFAWYNGSCDDFDDLDACYIGGLKHGDKVNEEGIREGVRKTYEEVLEEGIQKCLTILLEEQHESK